MATNASARTTSTSAARLVPARFEVSKEFLDNVLRKALRYDILEERGVADEWIGYAEAAEQWESEESNS